MSNSYGDNPDGSSRLGKSRNDDKLEDFEEKQEKFRTMSNSYAENPDGSSSSCEERISRLAKSRNDDKLEEFKEKQEKFRASKRALNTGDNDDEEEKWEVEPPVKKPMTAAERMMAQMGYKAGEGLGKNAQGIAEPVALSTQRGRTGLGSAAGKAVARDFTETWDETTEEKTTEENVKWLTDMPDEHRSDICAHLSDNKWIVVKAKKLKIDDETEFCDPAVLKDMLEAKDVFDHMSDKDLREARTRANPYETIGSAFFQNRAAMKTANMDKIYDWIFSRENTEDNTFLKKNPLDIKATPENTDRNEELFYFADVCAGPGGFSEYMLWRKGFYNAKGFGFTLAGKDDFKLNKFRDSSSVFFETFYGTKQNGDVMDPENIDSLEDFVMRGTDNFGVHLMMADGGFSVEGQENLQEILSKRLYLCQLLVSLCIVRDGGNFFCKLFDIFTPFSAALIYLMRVCYQSVSLHKPHTSRPANSERYITCKGLRRTYSEQVKNFLKRVNRKMDQLKEKNDPNDVQEIMPIEMLKADNVFMHELVEHNHFLAKRQTLYLRKYQSFAKNQGQFDKDQGQLREDCLKYWAIPNKQREKGPDRGNRQGNMERLNPCHVIGKYSPKMCTEHDMSTPPVDFKIELLKSSIPSEINYDEYRFVPIGSSTCPNAQILVGTGDTTFQLKNGRFEQTQKSYLRIPKDTILLVDFAEEYSLEGNKIIKSRNPTVVRILDAAVLYGDNVAHLPYEQRIIAAKKFVKALKLTNRQVKEGWGRMEKMITPHLVVTASAHRLSEIDKFSSQLKQGNAERELGVLFEEGGFTFKCNGLRFIRVIKQGWHLSWSKSQKHCYAHSPDQKNVGSIFEKDWQSKGVYASFWDTAMTTSKEREKMYEMMRKSSGHYSPVPAMSWSWKACIRTAYGPGKILNHPEEFEGKPTVGALKSHIEQNDAIAHRLKHKDDLPFQDNHK